MQPEEAGYDATFREYDGRLAWHTIREMTNRYSFLLILAVFSCAAASQTSTDIVPAHSILTLELKKQVPLRVGQSVSTKLVYPVYSRESLILPKEALFSGTVVALRPDRSKRVRSRFNLDFTPYGIPVVRFTQINLSDGTTLPIETDEVADGPPYRNKCSPRCKFFTVPSQRNCSRMTGLSLTLEKSEQAALILLPFSSCCFQVWKIRIDERG